MHRLLCVLALLAGVILPAGSATVAYASSPGPTPDSIGVRLLDAPADRRDDPRARLYIVDHLAPGATIQRRIEIGNGTAQPLTVSVYPGAASIGDGVFAVAEGRTPGDLTSWTSLDRSTVDLPAGGQLPVTATISVPPDAPAGERYGVVWAEVRSAAPDGGGITSVSRVGIRVYLSVGPGGEPASDFEVDSLTAGRSPDGDPVVEALVHNTGGRALDMNGTLQLSDGPGALSAGPFPAELGTTLAPGDSAPVTVVLDDQLPLGPWRAELVLTSGLLERAVEGTITFPAEPARAADPVPVEQSWPYPLWAGLALAALLFVLLLVVLLRRRGRRDDPLAPEADAAAAAPPTVPTTYPQGDRASVLVAADPA